MIKKVAVVTGGASGLGLGASQMLAKDGYSIAILDINKEGGEKAAAELSAMAPSKFYECNLTDMQSIKATVDAVYADFGRIDALMSAAGASKHLRVMDITEKDWDFFLTLDLKAQFFVSQAVAPYMRKSGGGRIVHFSSILGTIADGKHILYGAAKAALHSMVRELAVDLCMDNIQVNGIAPSYILTPFNARHLAEPGWEEGQLKRILTHRMMYGEDVASVLHFLVTCETPALTGQIVYTDGGYLGFRYKPEFLTD